jgi:hypothetical protein
MVSVPVIGPVVGIGGPGTTNTVSGPAPATAPLQAFQPALQVGYVN